MEIMIKGATRKADKIYCSTCGNDLTVEGSIRFMGHADGKETYSYRHKCNKCDALIQQIYERDEESKKLWAEDSDNEKAPTEAATSDVDAFTNNQVKSTSDFANCQGGEIDGR